MDAGKVVILLGKLASGIPISEADLLGLLEPSNDLPDLKDGVFWQLKHRVQYSKNSVFDPIAFGSDFSSRLIRTTTTAPGVSDRWYQAGYLAQFIEGSESEISNRVIPLNRSAIHVLPRLSSKYYLVFTPKYYLFNLTFEVYEWTGAELPQDKLIEGLL